MRTTLDAFLISLVLLLAVIAPTTAATAQEVQFPLADYEALRVRAGMTPEPAPPPPAPFALESADFDVRVEAAASARVVQRLTLSLFADGWQQVPLGEAGSFIAADLGGLEGRVAASGGSWSLHVRGKGRQEVRLESVVPLTRDETATRPVWRLRLRSPAAAVVRGRIAVSGTPEPIEEVGLGATGLARRAPDGAWAFVARPNAPIDVQLAGRRTLPEKARLPLRFETTSATASTLTRTRLTVRGWIEARVAQGRLPELRIPLPPDFEVVSVDGPVAGWNVEAGELVVIPLEPVETSLAVEVTLSGKPRDSLTSPLLTPRGGSRSLGFAKALVQGDGILELADAGGSREAGVAELGALPEGFRQMSGQAWAVADPARPPRWEAVWSQGTDVLAVQVDRLLVDVALGESGRASYQLWAQVRNRGAQQLVLTLPAGFELVEGRRDGLPVAPGLSPAAGFAVPLRAADEAQVIHLKGVLPLTLPEREGDLAVPLPALSAPAARVEVRVILPGRRTYTLADSGRAGQIGSPPWSPVSTADILAGSRIAQQLLSSHAASPAVQAGLFDIPPGFLVMPAAWSALSATPAPLVLHVETRKERQPWF